MVIVGSSRVTESIINVSHCFLVKGCSWELQCEDLEGLWKVCLAAARFWRASNGSGLLACANTFGILGARKKKNLPLVNPTM